MSKIAASASDIWRGMLQRRLWPIALVLLAALVAVPLLLTADPEPAPSPPPGQAADEAAELAAQPLVAVASAAERERARRVLGARKDPFKPTNQIKRGKVDRDKASASDGRESQAKQDPSRAGETAAAGRSPSSARSGGGAATAPTPSPSRPQVDAPAERPSRPAGSLTVRWGMAGDEDLETLQVERLDPLPTADEPLLVYLGLTRDGRSAVFMLDAGITVDGDGRCRPDPEDCQTVELAAGDTQFLEVVDESGKPTQYQLDLVRIHGRRAVASRITARQPAAADARATRRALRSLGHSAPTWRFDAAPGTLERTDAGD